MSRKNTNSTKGVMIVVPQNNQNRNVKQKAAKRKPRKKKQEGNQFVLQRAPISLGFQTSTDRRKTQFRFQRREFIGSVPSSVDYNVKGLFSLNPGSPASFPWLSKISLCYESYRFHRLKFTYIPRSPTTETGYIALCPDTNPHDPQPNSEVEAFQNERTKSGSPWQEISIELSPEMLRKRSSYFTRPLALNADKDLYDVGNLFVICGGNTLNDKAMGQLWVDYDVEFMTPESKSVANTFLMNNQSGSNSDPLGTYNYNQPPSASQHVQEEGSIIQSITTDGVGSLITFAKDFHGMLTLRSTGTGLTGGPSLTAISNATIGLIEDTITLSNTINNSAGTASLLSNLINVVAGGQIRVSNPAGTLSFMNLGLTPCFA